MNWIISKLPEWNSWIALLLYWIPLVFCAYGYTLRSAYKIRQDIAGRADAESKPNGFYNPNITIGTLIGYVAISAIPVANLFAAIFDVAPGLFSRFFRWCERVLDIPLVPKRKGHPHE